MGPIIITLGRVVVGGLLRGFIAGFAISAGFSANNQRLKKRTLIERQEAIDFAEDVCKKEEAALALSQKRTDLNERERALARAERKEAKAAMS